MKQEVSDLTAITDMNDQLDEDRTAIERSLRNDLIVASMTILIYRYLDINMHGYIHLFYLSFVYSCISMNTSCCISIFCVCFFTMI